MIIFFLSPEMRNNLYDAKVTCTILQFVDTNCEKKKKIYQNTQKLLNGGHAALRPCSVCISAALFTVSHTHIRQLLRRPTKNPQIYKLVGTSMYLHVKLNSTQYCFSTTASTQHHNRATPTEKVHQSLAY